MAARDTRPISWIAAARRAFDDFPGDARDTVLDALTVAAEGGMARIAKPMTGLGSGVLEIALRHRGNAFRLVYVLQIDDAIWVVHAFMKKSTQGVRTPRHEIDLIKDRLKRLRAALR